MISGLLQTRKSSLKFQNSFMELYDTLFQSLDNGQKLLQAVSCNLTDQLKSLIAEGVGN